MSDLVQQVSADQFLSLRESVSSHRSEKLREKHEFLLQTFACFNPSVSNTTSAPPIYHAKHKRNRHELKGNRTEKVRIGCRDLSRENFGRKDFMALMNKMTAANKDTILQSIRNAYRDECQNIYTEITWNMMQKSPEFHELHLRVITAIEDSTTRKSEWRDSWQQIANDFVSEQRWFPPDSVLQSDDYDEFCEFVKWRKSTIASIRALCMLEDHGWLTSSYRDCTLQALLKSIDSRIKEENSHGDKVMDALIEQLYALLTTIAPECETSVMTNVSHWYAANIRGSLNVLRPATRFKLYDLYELIEGKLKTS